MEEKSKTLQNGAKAERVYYLDCARVLAVVSITFNHALSRSFEVHEGTKLEFMEIPHALSLIKAVLYVFSRVGVPLFLMISGTLLLNRDFEKKEVRSRFLKHNWLNLFITTEIWLAIMFWYRQLSAGSALRSKGIAAALKSFVETQLFINQDTMASMWYMPMILCAYLLFPVLAVALKRLGDRYVLLLCVMPVVSAMIIPNINTALEAAGSCRQLDFAMSSGYMFSYYLVYVAAGYWISRGALRKMKTALVLPAFIVSFALTSLFQYWIYSTESDYTVRYADIGVLIASIFLFELIRRSIKEAGAARKPVTFVSKSAFGIYFLHICIMSGMNNVIDRFVKAEYLFRFLIFEVCAFVLSLIIIWITSKCRPLGRYLYMMK